MNSLLLDVPAPQVLASALEAIEKGVDWIVCPTKGVAVHDLLQIKRALIGKPTIFLGPESSGLLIGEVNLCTLYPRCLGPIAIISNSRSLGAEALRATAHWGHSSYFGIGKDPHPPLEQIQEVIEKDPQTKAIVVIGAKLQEKRLPVFHYTPNRPLWTIGAL